MSIDSSDKHYQNNKKDLKKACERYQSISKEEKEKEQQYGQKIYLKVNNKSFLNVEKNIVNCEKMLYYDHKNY